MHYKKKENEKRKNPNMVSSFYILINRYDIKSEVAVKKSTDKKKNDNPQGDKLCQLFKELIF